MLKTLLRRFYAPQMEALAEREAAKVSNTGSRWFGDMVTGTCLNSHRTRQSTPIHINTDQSTPFPRQTKQAAVGPAQGADRLVEIMDRYPSNTAIHECVPSEWMRGSTCVVCVCVVG